ncbi:MAG: hypothetical protein D6820_12265, partial [Lentisphaerae bacterium]
MKTKFWPLLIPLFLVALPIVSRQILIRRSAADTSPGMEAGNAAATDSLIIITPHPETIRHEFTQAFSRYYRQRTGREIAITWLSPGGTSDITRFIDDRYHVAFRRYWQQHRPEIPWSATIAKNFINDRIDPKDSRLPELLRLARSTFLDSDVGIGIDLFFGGGQYVMNKMARKGYAVDAGIQRLHPDWFRPEIIPEHYSGETLYDRQGRYYGVCLSTFGICYNPEVTRRLGRPEGPRLWQDLADAAYFRHIILADPTKSGSITKCFEMILQERMQAYYRQDQQTGLERGWHEGFSLIRRMAANAREITTSAGAI